MRYGNYSVLVREGSEKTESGYVGLNHGTQYTLQLGNHANRSCEAKVVIDGKHMGTFVLRGYNTAILERPLNDNGRFTFYADGTEDAVKAGILTVPNENRGLVQVTFTPEKQRIVATKSMYGIGGQSAGGSVMRGMGFADTEKTSGGITGLSGSSDQQFQTVAGLDLEESEAVTISLRLVLASNDPRPIQAVAKGNPIPAPV